MTQKTDHLQQLAEIKTMMERSSRFLSLSGLSGVFAGFFALAGAAAFYIFVNQRIGYGYSELAHRLPIDLDMDFYTFCFVDAGATLFLALAVGSYFTARKAKEDGQRIWDLSVLRFMFNLFIPLATGGLFCLILLFKYHWFGIIPPATLIFYGLALLNGSKYTLDEVRWLGISELILGLIGCLYLGYGVTLWAIGFGVLHIVYGLIMYIRYEAKPKEKKYW
ncbi:MAG: hypothetical protein JST90_16730 [Bacteroidetes bacterium]|nr:hypothetical protein [Bacteroidota bacterium]